MRVNHYIAKFIALEFKNPRIITRCYLRSHRKVEASLAELIGISPVANVWFGKKIEIFEILCFPHSKRNQKEEIQ